MGSGVNTDLLRTFVAIAETGSFTAAGRSVGRTQSAISLQMRRLEDSLGRPLFLKGTPGTNLTEHGVLLLGHARRILRGMDEAKAAFDRGTVSGVIVLGLPSDYAPCILEPVLQTFSELYPAATLDLVIDESRQLTRRLAEGSIDLAFVTECEGPVSGGPVAFRDRIVWVTPTGRDLHLLDPIPIAIWDESDGYARRMLSALDEMGRAYRTAVVSRSMQGLRGAVSSGLAMTAMMSMSVGPGMRQLTEADGFPALADLSIHIERAHLKKSGIIDVLEARLVDALKGAGGQPQRPISMSPP
jgi:DNA-binding transcriptional LysR family regulator